MPTRKRKAEDAEKKAKEEAERILRHRIIEEVENFPIIYNKQHPDHYQVNKKKNIFDEIGGRLGISGLDVADKWKSLVDSFRRRDKSGDAGETIQEKTECWEFFDKMYFMKAFIASRE